MTKDPNQYTVLGTLVDCAVCMPYANPRVLRQVHRRSKDGDGKWQTHASISDDIAEAAAFIARSLESPEAHQPWSPAHLALDPAGPWWSKVCNDFFDLDDRARRWVLDRLVITADQAASYLQERTEARDWSRLWSQPSFARPGKLRPTITRPDLIGGLDWRRCDVINLKMTKQVGLQSDPPIGQEASVQGVGQVAPRS